MPTTHQLETEWCKLRNILDSLPLHEANRHCDSLQRLSQRHKALAVRATSYKLAREYHSRQAHQDVHDLKLVDGEVWQYTPPH